MKKYFIILAAMLLTAGAAAQKIDERLLSLLPRTGLRAEVAAERTPDIDTAAVKQQLNVSFNEDGSVRSFSAIAMLKDGDACPDARLQKLGIELREEIGRMLILRVPAESLTALDGIDEIERVRADRMYRLMNDKAREKSRVEEVATWEKAAAHHLPQAYTGKGVLVGIIDCGIDFNHAAFRNADGSTRVKYAIRYINEYTYDEYTNPDDIASLTADDTEISHGSHVSAIAAGSRVEGLDRQGMAPEADLMLGGVGMYFSDASIISTIRRMFAFADEHGQPCVINLSLGQVTDFHDGKTAPILDALRECYKEEAARKGKIVVVASGNSGGINAAITTRLPKAGDDGYNLRTILGPTRTYIWEDQTVNGYGLIWNFLYNAEGGELDADARVVDVTTGRVYTLAEKPLYRTSGRELQMYITKEVCPENGKTYVSFDTYFNGMFHEPNLKLALFVKGPEGQTFRAIDWREGDTEGYRSDGLEGYTEGGDNGAFNVLTCADEVISVGAYVSRTGWTTLEGKSQSYREPTTKVDGGILYFSSWGEEDDGEKVRPDVIAPGSAILSAYNGYDKSYFEDGEIVEKNKDDLTDKVTLFGRDHYYGVKNGTSMSAPSATGVIALWLQAKPDLTYDDVRALIRETSFNDQYTTNPELIPSWDVRQAGAGKIDALAGLEALTGAAGIDVVAADEKRTATPATMISLDAPVYNVLGQRVSPKTKGIVIYKGKKYVNN